MVTVLLFVVEKRPIRDEHECTCDIKMYFEIKNESQLKSQLAETESYG